MDVTLKFTGGLRRILSYNEQKVQKGAAELIYARNFLKDTNQLTRQDKRCRFRDIEKLSEDSERAGVHIFIKFSKADELDNTKLTDIGRDFMREIGFDRHPYLVYRHLDAYSPHIHIVSINRRSDGTQMRLHGMLSNVTAPLQRQLEKEYGLLEGVQTLQNEEHSPSQRIDYGKRPNLQAIGETLKYVLEKYRYRSIDELNAVLRLYNLTAITGRPDSQLYKNHGLLYQITDDRGKGKGAPLKASAIDFKPTLKYLEPRFAVEEEHIQHAIGKVRMELHCAVYVDSRRPKNCAELERELRKNSVYAIPFFDKHDVLAKLFYIDMNSKTVVMPKELGPAYEESAIREKLGFRPFPNRAKAETEEQSQGQQQKRTRRRGMRR